jgi:tetratricopeptide (TPR) repeat protein
MFDPTIKYIKSRCEPLILRKNSITGHYGRKEEYANVFDNMNAKIAQNRKSAKEYYNCGLLYYDMGCLYGEEEDYTRAIHDFCEAVRLDSSCVDASDAQLSVYVDASGAQLSAYFDRGILYLESERYDNAIDDFSKIIKKESTYERAYFYKGIAYYSKKDYANAIDDFSCAIQPGYCLSEKEYCYRGLAYYYQNDYDKAIIDFGEAIKQNSKFADAYYNLGEVYSKKGDCNNAYKNYDNACMNYEKAMYQGSVNYTEYRERYEKACEKRQCVAKMKQRVATDGAR